MLKRFRSDGYLVDMSDSDTEDVPEDVKLQRKNKSNNEQNENKEKKK